MSGSDGQGRAPPNPLARPQDAAPGGVGGLTQPRLRPLTQPLTRRPYRQRPESEWLEIERLFVNGATAKALDFLRREGVTTVWWPDADDDTEPDKTGASAAPAPHG